MIFCPLPWIHSAIRNNGDYRVCCQANVSEGQGLLHNQEKALSAQEFSISEVRNSDTLKDIRKTLLSGEWPSSCQRCKKEEASGLRSRRIYENESWNEYFSADQALELTDGDGKINSSATPFLFLDVRFGNKCNLKCRMCGPTDSDFWYQDQGEIWGDTFKDTHGEVKLTKNAKGIWQDLNRTYDWYTDNSYFWNDLESHSSQIQKINIVGGEPLLIEKHYDFLEKMVRSNASKKIVLEYNTNLTILPQKALDLWSKFKKVRIGVSIDGFGDNNSYIRYPSKWSVLVKNLHRLNEADGPYELWLSATVQSLNAFEITDFIHWKVNESQLDRFNRSKRLPLITSHALHKPDFLSLKSLPTAVKKDVRDHYLAFIESAKGWKEKDLHPHLEKLLHGYLNFMESEDLSRHFPKFLKYTESLDRLRGDSLKTGAPKLYYSLKENGFFQTEAGRACIR